MGREMPLITTDCWTVTSENCIFSQHSSLLSRMLSKNIMFIFRLFLGHEGVFGIWMCLWRHQLCPSTTWGRSMNMLWPSKCYGQLDVTAQLWQGLGETRQAGRVGRQTATRIKASVEHMRYRWPRQWDRCPQHNRPLQKEQSESRCLWLTAVYICRMCLQRESVFVLFREWSFFDFSTMLA